MSADRALILCRQSLTRRDSVSLDHQEQRGRAYCDGCGYAVVDVLREESTRGWREDREAMAEIRALAARGGFDVLVAFDTSRIARKLRLLENLIFDLQKHRVRLECVTQDWVAHPLMRQVVGAFDEERSREIGRHVSGAVRMRAADGKSWGRVPLGYRRVAGALVIDPAGAEIVRQVFDRWLSGHSLRRIAAHLIATGVPAYSATGWAGNAVAWIVHNPVYVGDVRLNGRVVTQDAHDAIISRETWEAAQRRFSAPRVRDKPRVRSWVEGHVIHACGARMHLTLIPRSRPGGAYPDGYPSFRCALFNVLGRRCTEGRQHIGQPLLEEAVRQCLIADLSDVLDPAAAIRRQRRRAGSDAAQRERAKLTRELAGVAAQRREAESLVLTRRRDVAWLDTKDAEFRATEAAINARLAALPAVPDEGALTARWRDARSFRQGIALADGPALGRILAAVGVAVVSGEGIFIRYGEAFRDLIPEPVTMPVRRVKS